MTEEKKQYNKQYYQKNRQKILEYSRKRYQERQKPFRKALSKGADKGVLYPDDYRKDGFSDTPTKCELEKIAFSGGFRKIC